MFAFEKAAKLAEIVDFAIADQLNVTLLVTHRLRGLGAEVDDAETAMREPDPIVGIIPDVLIVRTAMRLARVEA